jgi:hypothetical protein
VDSPPSFFLRNPIGYQRFVEDELRWARAEGLVATLIISPPGGSGGDFAAYTKLMLRQLSSENALPTAYVVENYRSHPPPDFRNLVGSESDIQSVAGVALWVAQNTPQR